MLATGKKTLRSWVWIMPMGLVLQLLSLEVSADQLPYWELGLGGGVLSLPDYRGSDESRTYPFPLLVPFFRGRILRSDEEGVRGEMMKTRSTRLDFSLDGNVPVDAKKNAARRGMDTLEPTLQVGPALNIKLWRSDQNRQSLILFLPVRSVFAVDRSSGGMDAIGFTASPQFTFYQKVDFIGGRWRLGISAGLEYGSETFHDYYYQVNAADVTPERPAYNASGGFAGYRSIFTFHHRFADKWVSLFARYDNLEGAVIEDSPLVRKTHGFTYGFLVTWFVKQSVRQVDVEDWKYQ